MIVNLPYFGAEFETERATFQPASTDLDHALPWLDPDTGGRLWVIDNQYLGQATGNHECVIKTYGSWLKLCTFHFKLQSKVS